MYLTKASHQNYFVLEHQHGGCDVTCKRSMHLIFIEAVSVKFSPYLKLAHNQNSKAKTLIQRHAHIDLIISKYLFGFGSAIDAGAKLAL